MRWRLFITIFIVSCGQNNTQLTAKDIDTTAETDTNIMAIDTSTQNTIVADRLIVPGESIGKTNLGMDAASLENILGRPDMSDAAMGKAWLTWKGKPDEHINATELNIYIPLTRIVQCGKKRCSRSALHRHILARPIIFMYIVL